MPPKVSKDVNKKKKPPKIAEVGEKIICMQKSYLYEAKCIDIKKVNQEYEYLVHYKNWKSKHDEWVTGDRIHKYSEKNLKEMKKLCERSSHHKRSKKKSHENRKKKKEKRLSKSASSESAASSLGTSDLSTPRTLKTPSYVCKQDDFLKLHEIKIRVPDELKPILVDDWELIVNQSQLLKLPPKYSIDRILNEYYFSKKQSTKLPLNHTIEGYENFILNIKRYFNFLIEKDLLYPMEVEQLAYLKLNYETLRRNCIKDEILASNSKESRRPLKKHKKSRKQLVCKLPAANDDSSICSKPLNSAPTDNVSQSESTSDSSENLCRLKNRDLQPVKEETASSDNTEVFTKIDYTTVYGVIHLLRLFTKLGHFLFFTDLNDRDITVLNSYIQDFLKYLNKNLISCSDTLYINSTSFNDQNIPKEQPKCI